MQLYECVAIEVRIINYNLAAEYASALIISVAMVGFVVEKSVISSRYKGLKWMYYSTLVSVVITIASIVTADNHTQFSIAIVDFLKMLFFLSAPSLALFYLFYAMSIVYNKLCIQQLVKKFYWAVIPYIIYAVFVLTNPIHRLIFRFTIEDGYVKEELVHVSYYIAFIYFAIIIYFTIAHRKTPQKNVLVIICFNFLLSTVIFCLQIFIPLVQLSGLACLSGLLVVHLYILSVSKAVDQLTELNNRQTLTLNLVELCNSKTPFSLVVFSLRNFKSINERLGLECGDELLTDIALRLRNILPPKKIFRYSGDEFAYIHTNPENDIFDALMKELNADLSKPFVIAGSSLQVDFNYARIDFPTFGENVKEIISAMDYSISTVKKNSGETHYFYDISICDKMKRRNYIIERIKSDIANDGFEVYYQAIYASKTKNFPLAEALIRMKAVDGISISPGEFIPVAEEIGLVSKITYIVLDKVCKDLRYLIDTKKDKLQLESVSINFPYVHFLSIDTVSEVVKIVDSYNIPHDMIKMELTERTLVSDVKAAKHVMDELIELGFELELDDFGVEYSNLSLFFDMPIKIIKFDRSLVYSATSEHTRKMFLENLLNAIKAIGNCVVMEGVEDEELLEYLISCGCDYIQGYIFTKPLPLNEFTDFITKDEINYAQI